ncbi:MAG: RFX family transcription factor, partial [Pygmaiobacter massiliensis]|nr:RFX family transcription factor [Pygmaiobacter massiliensis]
AMRALRDLRSNNFVFTEIEQEIIDSACPMSTSTSLNEQQELALHQFVAQCCVIKPGAEILCAELHQGYRQFCIQMGSTPLTNTAFGSKLRRLYPSLGDSRHSIRGKQQRFVTGLTLLDGFRVLP